VLGDFLGSLAAIASGLFIHFLKFHGRFYFDPALSLLIVAIILFSSIPLVRSCLAILMQSVPHVLNLSEVTSDLQKIPYVISVHDLHVWQLKDDMLIGSVHVTCLNDTHFSDIAPAIKAVFHKYKIHSSTIQPEFLTLDQLSKRREKCQLDCEKECDSVDNKCCPVEYEEGLEESEIAGLLQRSKKKKKYKVNEE